MSKFDTIQLGDKARLSHTITQDDIDRFVQLTGDDNRLHTDSEFAGKTPLKKTVAHGMLSASFISTIIGTKLPGDGALWFSQNFQFLLPVRVGDTINIISEVIKKIPRDKIIELKTDIFNQHNQKVTTGVAQVKIVDQEEPQPEKKSAPIPGRPVAFVAGGSGGIGSAVCVQLAAEGFDIILHYNKNKEKALEVAKQIQQLGAKAVLVTGDITNEKDIQEIATQVSRYFDSITALVNCTTLQMADVKFEELEWQDIQHHFELQVKGCFTLVNYVLPMMKKNQYGKIVLITSQAVETPNAGWLPYITAKSALNGFSRSLALSLSPHNITVNLVSPGMTETPLIMDIPQKARLLTAARTPMGRLCKPEDVASAVSFLVSPKTGFITGETIRVNGGQVLM